MTALISSLGGGLAAVWEFAGTVQETSAWKRLTNGDVKDFFKFFGRFDGWVSLAGVRDYFPHLDFIASWTREWDHVDVFGRRLPSFYKKVIKPLVTGKELAQDAVVSTISFLAGVVKMGARHLYWMPIFKRLSLPLTAATAGAAGINMAYLAYSTDQDIGSLEAQFREFSEPSYASNDGSETALFTTMKGAYTDEKARKLIAALNEGKLVEESLKGHIKDKLRLNRNILISNSTHALVAATLLTTGATLGMGPWIAGTLVAMMLTERISRVAVRYMSPSGDVEVPRALHPLKQISFDPNFTLPEHNPV